MVHYEGQQNKQYKPIHKWSEYSYKDLCFFLKDI